MTGAHQAAEPNFIGSGAVEGGVKFFFLRTRDSGTVVPLAAVDGS
jgi:hypothetical protein